MTAALLKCAEHLRALPGVRHVVVDQSSGFLGSQLPAIMLDEQQIPRSEDFTGATTYLYLRWVVVVLAKDKRSVRDLLAKIRTMYRKNTQASADRFNDLHNLGVALVRPDPDAPGEYEITASGSVSAVHGIVELEVTYMEVSA